MSDDLSPVFFVQTVFRTFYIHIVIPFPHRASQKEAEMNKKFEEYKLFFQEALKLFMEHLENCKVIYFPE